MASLRINETGQMGNGNELVCTPRGGKTVTTTMAARAPTFVLPKSACIYKDSCRSAVIGSSAPSTASVLCGYAATLVSCVQQVTFTGSFLSIARRRSVFRRDGSSSLLIGKPREYLPVSITACARDLCDTSAEPPARVVWPMQGSLQEQDLG